MTVKCSRCADLFPVDNDQAHRLRSEWDRDGTRRHILCPPCLADSSWPRDVASVAAGSAS